MVARRGRPPKERFIYPMECIAPTSAEMRTELQVKLSNLPCVAQLSPSQQEHLLHKLIGALEDYMLAAGLNAKRKSPPGNKTKAHVSLLIYKCSIASCEVLGISETSLWEAPFNSVKESPPVQLVRECLSVATRKPYTASLRQQFAGATRWRPLPTEN
jgi:hypothetical protein